MDAYNEHNELVDGHKDASSPSRLVSTSVSRVGLFTFCGTCLRTGRSGSMSCRTRTCCLER
jgi:hypothetical protein